MLEKSLINKLLSEIKDGSLEITYWDDSKKTYGSGQPLAKVRIKDKAVGRAMMRNLSLGAAEAYMHGTLEIEEPIIDVLHIFARNRLSFEKFFSTTASYRRQINRKHIQKKYIAHHYDLSNDFYKLWLDNETMAYTCAYFKKPTDTLAQAQIQKFDHVLKKLQLKKGQTMLDIGCGWGHLLVRGVKKYGASGLGVTLSEEQYKYATELAKKEGVADKAKFELVNYQELLQRDLQFDRIVSVGILEHVGKANYSQYFDVVNKLLTPGGVSVLHTITQQKHLPSDAFLDKYIFPGAYLPVISEIAALLPEYDFRLTDYESLRLHYPLTLDEWLKGFEAHKKQVIKMFDEEFYRMWELYLASCSAWFRYGRNDLSQFVFTKGINNDLPLTREHIYK